MVDKRHCSVCVCVYLYECLYACTYDSAQLGILLLSDIKTVYILFDTVVFCPAEMRENTIR